MHNLAEQKESRILEGYLQADHVHMLVSIPPKYSVAQVVGFIKGKSAIHTARSYLGRRKNYTGMHFWARGYFVSTVGAGEAVIRAYIQNQGKEDARLDQLGLFAETRPPVGGQRILSEYRYERFTISSLRLCRKSLTEPTPTLIHKRGDL
jgi:putative transposase